jgi:hypothetical protein
MLQVEMKIDELAKFVYVANTSDARINIDLCGLEDAKDLFCFCVDLLCKGFVFICSETTTTKSINLDSITTEQFSKVAKKLGCTGILVQLVVKPNNDNLSPSVTMGDEFNSLTPPRLLKDYNFFITTTKRLYTINFDIASF